eukprot:1710205-Rhodomonas_salina.1
MPQSVRHSAKSNAKPHNLRTVCTRHDFNCHGFRGLGKGHLVVALLQAAEAKGCCLLAPKRR